MKVIFIPSWYPSPVRPVAGIFFRDQAEAIAAAGADCAVLVAEQRAHRTALAASPFTHRFQVTESVVNGVRELRSHGWTVPSSLARTNKLIFEAQCRALARHWEARHPKPDIIHAQCAMWAGYAARAIATRWRVPYVLTEHMSDFARGRVRRWQKPLIVAANRGAVRLLAVSQALARDIRPYADGRSVDVVPNVVDTEFFAPGPSRADHALSPFTFLSVGALVPNKGFDVLLRAFASAFSGDANVVLEIGGQGPERANLQQFACELGIAGQVQFHGSMSRQQVRTAMQRAQCFVSSSIVETFGVVLIEAMACGLWVIATDAGGPRDFVGGEVGELVTNGDERALALAMQRFHRSSAAIINSRHATASHRFVVERFGRVAVAQRLLQVYEAAVREAAGRVDDPKARM
jgi:glycosyltransferase involved in cell wall biosynthesis